MNERNLELKVGILVVGALGLLGVFFFILGNFSLGPGYRLYVDYNFSGNLQPGAPVKVSGITVGKVEDVRLMGGELDEKTGRRVQVRVEIWVERRVEDTIREDAEFFVNTTGVLGEKYLEIVPGSRERPAMPKGSYVVGVDPPRADLIIARAYEFLDTITPVLTENREQIRSLLGDSAVAVREIGTLLADNRESIGNLLVSADRLAGESASLIADVRTGIGDPRVIGRTIRDVDALVTRTDATMQELSPRIIALADEGTRVAGMLTDKRVARVDGVLSRTRLIMDETLAMMVDMRQGKGTVGQLLARDELYADLREMVRDLKRNPWKLIWKE